MQSVSSIILYVLPGTSILFFDQLIKFLIRTQPLAVPVFSMSGFVEIVPYFNTGAAFSMFSGKTALISLLSIGLLILITLMLLGNGIPTSSLKASVSCLIGGGLGNLLDRLIFGAVTDYIRLLFIPFPVFNLADISITLSVSYLACALLTGKLDKYTGEKHHGSSH